MNELNNDVLICQLAEDIEAGLITAESVLEVLTEKFDSLQIGSILQVMADNGYSSVIDLLIIAKHNKLLKMHQDIEFLEKCLIL